MTATDELRRLLDERGVEWTEPNNKARSHTTYWTAGFLRCIAVEFNDGMVSIASSSDDITPEQAVEATLGSDLQAENAELRELVHIAGTYCVNGMCGKDDGCPLYLGKPYCALPDRMRELGVEE